MNHSSGYQNVNQKQPNSGYKSPKITLLGTVRELTRTTGKAGSSFDDSQDDKSG